MSAFGGADITRWQIWTSQLHDDGLVGQAYYVIRVTDAEIASSAHGASSQNAGMVD